MWADTPGMGMSDIPDTSEVDNPIKDTLEKFSSRSIRYENNGNYALPQTDGVIPLISYYGAATQTDNPPMMNRLDNPTLFAELVLVLSVEPKTE